MEQVNFTKSFFFLVKCLEFLLLSVKLSTLSSTPYQLISIARDTDLKIYISKFKSTKAFFRETDSKIYSNKFWSTNAFFPIVKWCYISSLFKIYNTIIKDDKIHCKMYTQHLFDDPTITIHKNSKSPHHQHQQSHTLLPSFSTPH